MRVNLHGRETLSLLYGDSQVGCGQGGGAGPSRGSEALPRQECHPESGQHHQHSARQLNHLPDVETRVYYFQQFMSLDSQCRDAVFELK